MVFRNDLTAFRTTAVAKCAKLWVHPLTYVRVQGHAQIHALIGAFKCNRRRLRFPLKTKH